MAVFQWPQRVGPTSGSDSCHRTPSTRPREMLGQSLCLARTRSGEGRPTAAKTSTEPAPWWCGPSLQTCERAGAMATREIHGSGVLLGCLLDSHNQPKPMNSTEVIQTSYTMSPTSSKGRRKGNQFADIMLSPVRFGQRKFRAGGTYGSIFSLIARA